MAMALSLPVSKPRSLKKPWNIEPEDAVLCLSLKEELTKEATPWEVSRPSSRPAASQLDRKSENHTNAFVPIIYVCFMCDFDCTLG